MAAQVRLHAFMAACGVASRRKCEEIIRGGNVTVNGNTVSEIGTKIDDASDTVCLDGKRLTRSPEIYYVLNKPAGYITTNSDERDRKTVFDLVRDETRLFAVGRLDRDSEGLLILTNDGSFAQKVSHPRNRIPKTYEVVTGEPLDRRRTGMLEKGMYIDGYRTSPAKVRVCGTRGRDTVSRITLCEGRKRQVRKMYASMGLTVKKLTRIRIGGFSDQTLKQGSYRKLTQEEIDYILQGGDI